MEHITDSMDSPMRCAEPDAPHATVDTLVRQ